MFTGHKMAPGLSASQTYGDSDGEPVSLWSHCSFDGAGQPAAHFDLIAKAGIFHQRSVAH